LFERARRPRSSASFASAGTSPLEIVSTRQDFGSRREPSRRVRELVRAFVTAGVPHGADGQIDRAAHRFGLVAAAGELATLFGLTPWREGEATEAAAWALTQWIDGRGGTEPAETSRAIATVRRFIEAQREARFDNLDDCEARPKTGPAGARGQASNGDGLFQPRPGSTKFARAWTQKPSPEFWLSGACLIRPETDCNPLNASKARRIGSASSRHSYSTGATHERRCARPSESRVAARRFRSPMARQLRPLLRLKSPKLRPLRLLRLLREEWGEASKRASQSSTATGRTSSRFLTSAPGSRAAVFRRSTSTHRRGSIAKGRRGFRKPNGGSRSTMAGGFSTPGERRGRTAMEGGQLIRRLTRRPVTRVDLAARRRARRGAGAGLRTARRRAGRSCAPNLIERKGSGRS